MGEKKQGVTRRSPRTVTADEVLLVDQEGINHSFLLADDVMPIQILGLVDDDKSIVSFGTLERTYQRANEEDGIDSQLDNVGSHFEQLTFNEDVVDMVSMSFLLSEHSAFQDAATKN